VLTTSLIIFTRQNDIVSCKRLYYIIIVAGQWRFIVGLRNTRAGCSGRMEEWRGRKFPYSSLLTRTKVFIFAPEKLLTNHNNNATEWKEKKSMCATFIRVLYSRCEYDSLVSIGAATATRTT